MAFLNRVNRGFRSRVRKLSLALGEAALTAAATSEAVAIGTIPSGATVLGSEVQLATPFSGGGASTCVVDIGSTGDADAIVDGANLFASAVDGQAATKPAGIAPNKTFATATVLNATVTADVNVVGLTAGAATIVVYYAEAE